MPTLSLDPSPKDLVVISRFLVNLKTDRIQLDFRIRSFSGVEDKSAWSVGKYAMMRGRGRIFVITDIQQIGDFVDGSKTRNQYSCSSSLTPVRAFHTFTSRSTKC